MKTKRRKKKEKLKRHFYVAIGSYSLMSFSMLSYWRPIFPKMQGVWIIWVLASNR